MTWDYEWGYKDQSICRGLICKGPFFSGETEPDVKSNAKICKLEYGQTCVKHVKYDKYDKKTPTFIARYCGRGQVSFFIFNQYRIKQIWKYLNVY